MVLRLLNFKKCCDMSCLPKDNDLPTSISNYVMVSNLHHREFVCCFVSFKTE